MTIQDRDRCHHGLLWYGCTRCSTRPVAVQTGPANYTLIHPADMEDEDGPMYFRPVKSWGGEGTVPVLVKDRVQEVEYPDGLEDMDEGERLLAFIKNLPEYDTTKALNVNIPSHMQYMWMVGDRAERAAKLSAIAFHRIPQVCERKGFPLPSHEEREDIAQTALTNYIEWLTTLEPAEQARMAESIDLPWGESDGIKKLSYYVTNAIFLWRNSITRAVDVQPIDGYALGFVERWAQPGDYKPMMKLLHDVAATAEEQRTTLQRRILTVWKIFDPEMKGYMTRDTIENPLNGAERKDLTRLRQVMENQTDDGIDVEEVRNSILALMAA